MTTEDIKIIQKIVGVTQDGIMGPKTQAAIKVFQTSHGLVPDGVVGPKTIAVMQSFLNSPSGSSPVNKFEENYKTIGDTQTSTYGYQESLKNEGLKESTVKSDLKIAGDTGMINSSFIQTLLSDPSIIAYYTHALTYGNYQVGDMINDAKRRELISQGNTQLEDLKIIDPEIKREQYLQTVEGQKSTSDTAKSIPTFDFAGLLNPEILNYGADMPEEFYNDVASNPMNDPTSSEFKKAVEDVKNTYFDLASASLQAETEQQKAVADNNLKEFQKQVNEKYGILLSDNADKAWTQIENLADSFNTRGIAGSGLQNEAIDQSLNSVRKNDQRQREAKLTEEEKAKATYYQSTASDSEIANLTSEERQKYGLTPSSDIIQQFSIENLKAKYPDWTDKMIQQVHDSIIDGNGNYRSTLYKNYYSSIANTEQSNQATAVSTVKQNNIDKQAQKTTDLIGDTTGEDVLKPITLDTKPNNNDTGLVPINTKPVLDSNGKASNDPSYKFDTSTEQLNPNYIDPVTGKASNDSSYQYNTATGQLNTNYKAPVVTQPVTPPVSTYKAPTTTQPATPAKTGYQGSSIVDYLSSTGGDSSYASRKTLATSKGITNYTGSANQNTQLLKTLRGY